MKITAAVENTLQDYKVIISRKENDKAITIALKAAGFGSSAMQVSYLFFCWQFVFVITCIKKPQKKYAGYFCRS